MVSALLVLPVTFVVALVWGPWYIARLRDLKLGKQIRLEGPSSHQSKAGTPTMGGWLFLLSAGVVALVFFGGSGLPVLGPALLTMALFALFGTIDDYANLRSREGLGIRVRRKFLWHSLLAAIGGLAIMFVAGQRGLIIPGIGTADLGWWFLPFAVLVIFGTSAGVNEIDGLDGLAGGTSAIAYGAFGAVALREGQTALAGLCLAVAGGLLGFLWFNVNPARVFMGDTGALGLGAGLAAVALLSGWALLLLVIGFIFVVEVLSVVLQVGYFKATGGRRLFRMSPLHHHFELIGWPEPQIVMRFWIVTAVSAVIG
ncbi:MAG: phospho-N-acetylmuramoyl-pentapeptide-transferase, partial [Chloroflexi bacterium]|nr:phospho-N-acetylmuramoyl-pentapeptide-transferase [Chloroflexota bacterium]